MWFSQLFLKVDNGVTIELYKEDNRVGLDPVSICQERTLKVNKHGN